MTTTQALITAATLLATDIRLKQELIAENDELRAKLDVTAQALREHSKTIRKLSQEHTDLTTKLDTATQARQEAGVAVSSLKLVLKSVLETFRGTITALEEQNDDLNRELFWLSKER
jgi:chromosome segregation ATPase